MPNLTEAPATTDRAFIEAIAFRRLIEATYNGNEMKLAPHQLFTRRGDLFVSALNTGKTWRSEDERRLGYFKLDGLSNVRPTNTTFEPLPGFDGSLPGEEDQELFRVE